MNIIKETFEEYIENTLRHDFSDIDIDEELKKFQLYWSEGKKKLKRPKLAFRNWLNNARKYKLAKNYGTYRGYNQKTGQSTGNLTEDGKSKFTSGRFGRFAR